MTNQKTRSGTDAANFLQTIVKTVNVWRMVSPDESVLVGVSGGVDSVTLLAALHELTGQLGIRRLGVAHVNHGLRGKDADDEADFVVALAAEWRIPCYTKRVDAAGFAAGRGLCLEEAARQIRYNCLQAIAGRQGYDKIATGHHAGDNAELVLMNLLRGSGPAGLAGIPPIREKIVRPLIELSRADILDFAASRNLSFVEDQTNTDLRFLRNRVRHQLLPHLKQEYNPGILENLNRTARIFRDEEAWQQERLQALFEQACLKEAPEKVTLSASFLHRQPRAVQRRLFRKAVEKINRNLRKIAFEHVEAICLCLEKNSPFHLDLPGPLQVRRQDEVLHFFRSGTGPDPTENQGKFFHTVFQEGFRNASVVLEEVHSRIDFSLLKKEELPDIKRQKITVAFFDLEKLTPPLVIRNVLPGDRFSPLGLSGTQKIKDFFINNKIPPFRRKICPVLVSGASIIWLVGYRPAETAKITTDTRRVLKAELFSI